MCSLCVQHGMTIAVPRLVISFHRVPHAEAWGYVLQPLRGKDKHNLRRAHGVSRAGAALANGLPCWLAQQVPTFSC